MAVCSRFVQAAARRPATAGAAALRGAAGVGAAPPLPSSSRARSATVVAAQPKAAAALKDVPTIDSLSWQRPLAIVKYPDPRLRAVNARLSPSVPRQQLLDLAAEMFELMYQDDGVGLAAPQVGVNVRLMVFNEFGPEAKGGPSETILVNPEIALRSRRLERDEEGCLSFPKIYADVERSDMVEVVYYDLDFKRHEKTLTGWVARIFQHEYDHLQGVLFHDRMKASELAKVRDRVVAMEESFMAANPGVAVQRLGAASGGGGGGSGSAAKGFGGGGGGAKGFGGGKGARR